MLIQVAANVPRYETFTYVLLLNSAVWRWPLFVFLLHFWPVFITPQNTERTAGPYLYMLCARVFVSDCVFVCLCARAPPRQKVSFSSDTSSSLMLSVRRSLCKQSGLIPLCARRLRMTPETQRHHCTRPLLHPIKLQCVYFSLYMALILYLHALIKVYARSAIKVVWFFFHL